MNKWFNLSGDFGCLYTRLLERPLEDLIAWKDAELVSH